MIENDEVWAVLSPRLRGARGTKNGFYHLNCPMCVTRGETKDTRNRLNIKYDFKGIGANCFNCGFKTRYSVGIQLSKNMQGLLRELGVSDVEIKRISYWAWQKYQEQTKDETPEKPAYKKPSFKRIEFPEGTKSITQWATEGCENSNFLDTASYVLSRSHSANPDELYWNPSDPGYLIIPCIFNGNLVGWTARSIYDGVEPRYNNMNVPKNFLFNCDIMNKTDRKYLIIVEGIFDAKAISGVSTMGAKINDYQLEWLNHSPLTKIVVPDRDQAGKRLIAVAKENNWYVSVPSVPDAIASSRRWDQDIKDADDAVKRYGKLWSLHSILKHKTKDHNDIAHIEQSITK